VKKFAGGSIFLVDTGYGICDDRNHWSIISCASSCTAPPAGGEDMVRKRLPESLVRITSEVVLNESFKKEVAYAPGIRITVLPR
jgi:hypothetical protein